MRGILILALAGSVVALSAQGPVETPATPTFEVASVKANESGSGSSSTRALPNGQFIAPLNTSVSNRTGRIQGGSQTTDDIARAIAGYAASRMVVNRTGLEGAFDYELRWTLDDAGPLPAAAGGAADEPPSLFTAIQDQLGLKVESDRGPVEFLVIQSVSPLTPD
jgi:hypothetical protein